MTTCILPTKTAIATYEFTPIQLNRDAEVERFLTQTNNYDFLLKLMKTLRDGKATSFEYISDLSTCQFLMYYLTQPEFGYAYDVSPTFDPTKPFEGEAKETLISVQSPTPVLNSNSLYKITVTWA